MFIQIYPYPKVSQSNHPRCPSFMSWSLPPHPRFTHFSQALGARNLMTRSPLKERMEMDSNSVMAARRDPKNSWLQMCYPWRKIWENWGKKNGVESSETAEIQETSLGDYHLSQMCKYWCFSTWGIPIDHEHSCLTRKPTILDSTNVHGT